MWICPSENRASEHIASREYPLKAAFVYNFIKFTRWLSEEQLPKTVLCLAVVGPDPFGDALQPLEHKTAAGRPIVLTHCLKLSGQDAPECEVVFIAYQQPELYSRVLAEVQGKGVLTIGDAPGFARHGGCVELVKQQDKICFIINKQALRQQGLELSYKVYAMALEVVGEENE